MRGRLPVVAPAALACALLVTLAAGCGREPSSLDRGATERAVRAAVSRAIEPEVDSATCPGSLRRGRGRTTPCTVELGGGIGSLRVRARQVDDDGHLSVQLLDVPLRNEAVASRLRSLLKRGFDRSFQATCGPDGWRIRAVGKPFVCRARDETSRRSVEVTVVDASGRIRFELVD